MHFPIFTAALFNKQKYINHLQDIKPDIQD